ncbi:vitamin K epoxide reductase family protein [Candidatus Microgenomates bacterium]|nr:vitamin K epoxide reductase family protein [Candidatus Microgenomates bacterium]
MPTSLILIFIFSIIGITDTLYLIYHKIKGTEVACIFFPPEWCRRVQQSKYSKTFGIPNSVAGLVMYLVIFVLAILYFYSITPFWWLEIPITIGFLFATYFTYIQAFVLRAFCTWCVLSAINFVVLMIASFIL